MAGTHKVDGKLENLAQKAVNYEGLPNREIQLRTCPFVYCWYHQLGALITNHGYCFNCTCMLRTICVCMGVGGWWGGSLVQDNSLEFQNTE